MTVNKSNIREEKKNAVLLFLSRTTEKEEFQVRVSNTKHISRPILQPPPNPPPHPPRHVRNYNSIGGTLHSARREKGDKIVSIFYSSKGMVCVLTLHSFTALPPNPAAMCLISGFCAGEEVNCFCRYFYRYDCFADAVHNYA